MHIYARQKHGNSLEINIEILHLDPGPGEQSVAGRRQGRRDGGERAPRRSLRPTPTPTLGVSVGKPPFGERRSRPRQSEKPHKQAGHMR